MKKIIQLKNISKSYNQNKILNNISLDIYEKEFITLLGPSGCGKTTMLRLIGGFEEVDSGDLILDDIRINDIKANQRPINTVFQSYALFPHLNVFDNVAFGLRNFNRTVSDIKTNITRKYETKRKMLQKKLSKKGLLKEQKIEIKHELKELKKLIKQEVIDEKNNLREKKIQEVEKKYSHAFQIIDNKLNQLYEKEKEDKKNPEILKKIENYELNRKEAKIKYHLELKSAKKLMLNKVQIEDAVKMALKMVKLEGFEKRKITDMSGGQQQRVAIARAIVNRPRILLLDEPLAALDLKLRQDMHYELKEMQKELGITFIFVTHDQEEALTMSDRICVLNNGKIEQIGSPEDIYNEPKNRFVANFIGESNIIRGVYLGDKIVRFLGCEFECVDNNFQKDEVCDIVIRPEDFDIVDTKDAKIIGIVSSVIFKGIFFEICAMIGDIELVIRKYELFHVGDKIGLMVDPYEIHLMKVENEGI